MSCEHCVRTIENELGELDGINSVHADLNDKSVSISIDDTMAWDTVLELLKEINYPAEE